MGSHTPDAQSFAYPKLLASLKTTNVHRERADDAYWNAEFYPYGDQDEAPVFSLSNKYDMTVCRLLPETDPTFGVEILRHFAIAPHESEHDEQPDHDEYCASTWAYLNPDEPLLLGAGDAGFIRVFDVVKGDLKTTLVGHGQGIVNELATHPLYPWIVASASFDKSIRIWDLRRWNSKHESPTVIICGAGYGHKESVLSVSWHDTGRYLISGGFDNRICVWCIPDLSPGSDFWNEISPHAVERHSERVRTIMSPHFVTIAIHSNWVDCVRFWGDDIFSKAPADDKGAGHKMVLWRITGFNSSLPQPEPVLAPKAEDHLDTRNGFMRELTTSSTDINKIITKADYCPNHSTFITSQTNPALQKRSPAYERLLSFHLRDVDIFFMRFDLLKRSHLRPDLHDSLVIGNTKSVIYFWDLEAIELGTDHNAGSSARGGGRGGGRPRGRGSHQNSYNSAPPRKTAHAAAKPALRRVNQLLSLPRSDSAPSSLHSMSVDGALDSERTTPSLPDALERSNSTDATSLASDNLVPNNAATAENRDRFPLHDPSQPLTRAHHAIKFGERDQFSHPFTARGAAWSPCGRYVVLAGEVVENVYADAVGGGKAGSKRVVGTVKTGAALVFGR